MKTINAIASLGADVRTARRRRNLTQAQLASSANVSRAFVIELERGQHQRAELGKVLAVLDALGLDLMAVPHDPSTEELSAEERTEALADVIDGWRHGEAVPDEATQAIVHEYIVGGLSIDEAITQIDALPQLASA